MKIQENNRLTAYPLNIRLLALYIFLQFPVAIIGSIDVPSVFLGSKFMPNCVSEIAAMISRSGNWLQNGLSIAFVSTILLCSYLLSQKHWVRLACILSMWLSYVVGSYVSRDIGVRLGHSENGSLLQSVKMSEVLIDSVEITLTNLLVSAFLSLILYKVFNMKGKKNGSAKRSEQS